MNVQIGLKAVATRQNAIFRSQLLKIIWPTVDFIAVSGLGSSSDIMQQISSDYDEKWLRY